MKFRYFIFHKIFKFWLKNDFGLIEKHNLFKKDLVNEL